MVREVILDHSDTSMAAERPPLRWLWQVPLFLIGVATLGIALILRMTLVPGHADRVAADLVAARELLEQPDWDFDRVLALAAGGMDREEEEPALAAEAHFLIGTAYLRLADRPGAGPPSNALRQARHHLEKAEKYGVSEVDRPHVAYRLARVLFRQGASGRAVIDRLASVVDEAADDPAEGYQMLADSYLALPEPDLEAALAANTKLLALPLTRNDVLSPVRLQHGDLLLRLHRFDQARETLKRVAADATPALQAKARYLLALCFQEEKQWGEALFQWKAVLADGTLAAADAERVRYEVGICHQRLGENDEAAAAWDECMARNPRGEAATAAALALAELRLQRDQTQAAADAFAQALFGVRGPADWTNRLVSLKRCRDTIEGACVMLRQTGHYEQSDELAVQYERLGPNGNAFALQAEAHQQWAMKLASDTETSKNPQLAAGLRADAMKHSARAAEAYEKAAGLAADPGLAAERQWSSALRFLDADNPSRAATRFEAFLKTGKNPELRCEAWYRLAETYRTLQRDKDARVAYEKAIEVDGPYAWRARHRLALDEMERGNYDDAEPALVQNLNLAKQTETERRELSLYALGHLYLDQKKYSLAREKLETALHEFPDSPEARKGRFGLAFSYDRLAEVKASEVNGSKSPDTKEFYLEEEQGFLRLAASGYEKLIEALLARQSVAPLSDEERIWLTEASFGQPSCLHRLREFEKAIKLYEGLVARYHHQPPSLKALERMAACYHDLGQKTEETLVIQRLRSVLEEMDDAALTAGADPVSRKQWQQYLRERTQQLAAP